MSRQNYYQRRTRRQGREVAAEKVLELVRRERQEQPRLGTRKLHYMLREELAQAQVQIGRDRLFQLLGANGLLLERLPAEYPVTTSSGHYLPVARNRIKGLAVQGPNEVWVGDLTYVRTGEGFLYLALLTDRYSRKIVGYHCGDTLEATGCLAALEVALAWLPAGARPIHHTDRGSQYCCHEYVRRLGAAGLPMSMTEVDHCAENALAERMNGILKGEYGLGGQIASKALARKLVDQAVKLYNTRRPHTALGYQVPEAVHRQTGPGPVVRPPSLRSGSRTTGPGHPTSNQGTQTKPEVTT